MKIFPNTVLGVINGLEQIFSENRYADRAVDHLLKTNRKWGKRDRNFVAENIYGIVRNWRKLWALYGTEPDLSQKGLTDIFGVWWLYNGYHLPDWEMFNSMRNFDISKAKKELPNEIGVTESYPEWLDKLAKSELGEEWNEIAKTLNKPAAVALRVNTLTSYKQKVRGFLDQEKIEHNASKVYTDALFLKGRPKLSRVESYNNGYYEIQDAGSQTIAPFCNAKPGDFVIDACSGAGGKALHLAALMKNQGTIISLDTEYKKLSEQKKRAKRNGVKIIKTYPIINKESTEPYKGKADVLLLDMPCSGTGVIRREPDTKWKLNPEFLKEVIQTQRNILSDYIAMLKTGGTLVYATCSIFKSENEDQTQWFLENHKDFVLEEEKRLNPGELNDGFYMARMRKNG